MSDSKFPLALTNLPLFRQGKTRDTFHTLYEDYLLQVVTKRISTHNIVHKSEIPFKDQVLTALTLFWMKILEKAGIRHHVVAWGKDIYSYLPGTREDYPADLHYYAIVIRKLDMILVEFIFRNYLAGSLYHKIYVPGLPNPYGRDLPPGMQVMTPFVDPYFTPTKKSEHDEPMYAEDVKRDYPAAYETTIQVVRVIRAYLRSRGKDMVDTKLEVGFGPSGQVVVGDEIVTPDSSRVCALDKVKVGEEPPWEDKQIVRDEAERMWGDYPKVPLTFPPEIIDKVTDTYRKFSRDVMGMDLRHFQRTQLD